MVTLSPGATYLIINIPTLFFGGSSFSTQFANMKPVVGLAALLQIAAHVSAQDEHLSPSDLENYWSYGHSESVPDTRKSCNLIAISFQLQY